MDTPTQITISILGIIAAVASSQGMWAWLQRRDTKRSATTRLLLGLAHDRIIFLGMGYVDRGWITKDEYEDFMHYLCTPYAEFGGNGLAEKVISEVKRLPIHGKPQSSKIKDVYERNE